MYPNTHDVVPLPARPDLDQYRKQAKDLVKACRNGGPGALREWAARWPDHADQLEPFARETLARRHCALTAAQFVIARAHGFSSWPAFAAHLESVEQDASSVSRFERAVDAIVAGDAAALQTLLREDPALVRARSTRGHGAALLHYAGANGVENYRQKTPSNIVAITAMLLDAGAEVDAEADIYGGGSTTLGLAATSVHPEAAGVQNALMQLLIDRGARIDFVNECLANGRGAAAEYLAASGAPLDLEGAAGVGRVDVVASYFAPDGTLKTTAIREQMHAAFAWACEWGRIPVVEFLLDHGVRADEPLRPDGQIGLHPAAIGGHAEIVSLLLARGAPVGAVERTYNGTPLTWALFGWSHASPGARRDRYYAVIARLVRAGADVNPAWLDADAPETEFGRTLRADPRMIAAIRGDAG